MTAQSNNKHDSFLNTLKTGLPTEVEQRMEHRFQDTVAHLPSKSGWTASPFLSFRWQLAGATAALVLVALVLTTVMPTRDVLANTYEVLAAAQNVIVEYIPAAEIENPHQVRYTWSKPDLFRMDTGEIETQWIHEGKIYVFDRTKNRLNVMENAKDQGAQVWSEKIADFAVPDRLKEVIQGCKYEYVETIERDGKRLHLYKTKREPMKQHLLIDAETFLPAEQYWIVTVTRNGETITRQLSTYRYRWNQDIDPSYFIPEFPGETGIQTVDFSQEAVPHEIVPGQGVGPVHIGMSVEALKELWGEPNSIRDSFVHNYWDHGVELMVSDKVEQIICVYGRMRPGFKTFAGKTAGGAGIGSTEDEIIAAMGEPDERIEHRQPNAPADQSFGVSLNYTSRGCMFSLMPNAMEKMEEERRAIMILIQPPS